MGMVEAQDERPARPSMERAEELVDGMGRRVGPFASLVGLRLLQVAALAREAAEDIWAEAQSAREERGRRQG
ncbi:MAG: hypothetical protein AVDCRST_MAG49-1343 [uncultured Thermomicrobiales bacterium]|uniref:Uncharacterized protein n=1 Tax=uncultured Thermomicrobiales bacterium TaxID=1645740 RepID=A0A6J4UBM6_9BACT|nr:MAG: hypothetical protein AVDCRST_MAG49-1343 [uncultured Thermomicrobiales bacterium]